MMGIAQNEVQLERIKPEQPHAAQMATVSEVHADGLVLQFDGENAPRAGKKYKVNTSCTYAAGMRVYVVKLSGTYLVVCPVGNPVIT